MARGINKDDPKRWVIVRFDTEGVDSFVSFGNLGEVGSQGLSTNRPIVLSYMTEQELETVINQIADDENYYQDAVETENDKFMMPSGLYEYGLRANEVILEDEEFINPNIKTEKVTWTLSPKEKRKQKRRRKRKRIRMRKKRKN